MENHKSPYAAESNHNPPNCRDRDETFFSYYSMLTHQQNMLLDQIRTTTYHDAITQNSGNFKDKVVLDVGTGTGILSFFAAKAGAKRVYAVEASEMAGEATKLVEHNALSHIITVIKGKVEEIELPELVDVIISEPMGVLLVHERMMESFIVARDRFLKKPSTTSPTWDAHQIFPASSNIYFAPFTDMVLYSDAVEKVAFWNNRDFYGLDLSPLLEDAKKSQFSQCVVGPIDPRTILAAPISHNFAFNSMHVDEIRSIEIPLNFVAAQTGIIHGIAGWFDVCFLGSDCIKVLTTSPHYGTTHWYQGRFLFPQPIAVNQGQKLTGLIRMRANEKRSHDVEISLQLGEGKVMVQNRYVLQDQQYWNLAGVTTVNYTKDSLGIY